MNPLRIPSFIKTPCGRAKYQQLAARNGILSKMRLIWFVIFASIKDWNLPNPDNLD